MAEKFNFTQQRIEKLPMPEKDRKDYYDTDNKKLICRVSASGNKTFCVLKRTSDGKLQRVTLGKCSEVTVKEARDKATAALSDLDNGINPAEKKRIEKIKKITLSELMAQYIDQKGSKLSAGTANDYRKKLGEGFSGWLDKPVNSITREMVAKRHKALPGNSTSKDNKMRILRLLMNSALALKIIEENPCDVLKKSELDLWSKPTRKSRIIPADSLKDWYSAVLQLTNSKAKTYLLLLLHTGLRANEALHLEWKNVDFKNDTVTVMDTKNHSNFTTYIPTQLKPYLRSLQELTGNNSFVFPGDNQEGTMAIPRWPLDQVTLKTGIEFSSHDLRRTFATIAEASLLPETIIKRLLNHTTDNCVTGGYIRTESNTLKQAIDRIAGFIQEHVTPDIENIVSINKSITN
ncbi:tyrosine-type recombinase/integrase [Methylobacter psychrophilus]|uniref:tyrosine-type recombinase/integrase n=1 Tax=Methylobacter psychrophilus TaxID=96941 RepID=UPI0021D4C67A|nr:tyrosine-type recombinase/integrase [Methylobacter psychrophilus]